MYSACASPAYAPYADRHADRSAGTIHVRDDPREAIRAINSLRPKHGGRGEVLPLVAVDSKLPFLVGQTELSPGVRCAKKVRTEMADVRSI